MLPQALAAASPQTRAADARGSQRGDRADSEFVAEAAGWRTLIVVADAD